MPIRATNPGPAARRSERSPAARGSERGSATVEFALVLPVVVALVVALAGFASATISQLRCADAARAVARSASTGGERNELEAIVDRQAGGQAELQVARDGEWVRVTVSAPATTVAGGLVPQRVSATATAWCEPGVGGQP